MSGLIVALKVLLSQFSLSGFRGSALVLATHFIEGPISQPVGGSPP